MIVGVDAGGTKTIAILACEAGHVRGFGRAGPANYQTIGLGQALQAIEFAVKDALSWASVDPQSLLVVLGLAGVDRREDQSRVEQALRGVGLFHNAELVITNDARIALVGAVGEEYGVALIAGTGAIAFGINRAGTQKRADGWGHLLGDEGSGYWISQEALRAVLRAYDGRGPSTILDRYLLQRLGLARPEDLVEWAYYKKPSVDMIASLASSVFAAAAKGDKIAIAILRRAGRTLGRAAASVIRRLDLADEPFPFVTTGGLFKGEPTEPLLQPVRRTLRAVAPKARWVVTRFPPEIGAVIVGFSRRGSLSEQVLENLAQGIPGGAHEGR